MNDRGIVPELEIFDLGMANYGNYLVRKGILRPPLVANLFFGNVAGAQPTLAEVGVLVDRIPAGAAWCAAGIGRAALTVPAIAIFSGGGVRVGLEDGLWSDRARTALARNIDFVERVHQLASIAERPVMTPAVFRRDVLGKQA